MLRALTENVDNVQDEMSNFRREMETIRKNQMERRQTKTPATEMKNAFDGAVDAMQWRKGSVNVKIDQHPITNTGTCTHTRACLHTCIST